MLIMLQYFPLKTDIEKPLKQNIFSIIYLLIYMLYAYSFSSFPQQYIR